MASMQSMNLDLRVNAGGARVAVVLSPRPRPCPSPFPASQGGHTVSNVLTTNWHDEEFSGWHKTARREGRALAAQHSIYQIKSNDRKSSRTTSSATLFNYLTLGVTGVRSPL